MLLANGTIVTPEASLAPGWLELSGDRIAGVGAGEPPRPADIDLAGRLVVPGFVDTHVHGGGGESYLRPDPEAATRVADFHLRHGTTTTYASLITAPPETLERQIKALAGPVADGTLAGIHLEGPWLSAAKCGAHDPTLLRTPDWAEVRRLVDAGRGTIRMVTLAPELAGASTTIRGLVDAGVIVAVGHTNGTYDEVRTAIDAGATIATHLFNAMPSIHHREPGPVVALCEDERVSVELIADGVHLHAGVVGLGIAAAGVDRSALITDAMTAAGMPDGPYDLGGQLVRVEGGVARLANGDSIAGSTLTMDAAFRFAVRRVGLSVVEAARCAATTPARAHGLRDVGALRTGLRADFVVLDEDLSVRAVWRSGVRVAGSQLDWRFDAPHADR